MRDSLNGIEHKCPCCGYEVEWDWGNGNSGNFVKGDESFIKIGCNIGTNLLFKTDKSRKVDWGEPDCEKVLLLGCPKCGAVSYKIW